MEKTILKIKSIKSDLAKATNGGDIQGIYWRLQSIITKEFGATNIYIKRLDEMDNIDYLTQVEKNRGKLKGIIENILDDIDETSIVEVSDSFIATNSKEKPRLLNENKHQSNKKVFIVHGHNEAMKQSVARIIERLNLEPVILHEQPNQGLTIIEKFMSNSNVGFAIVLLSADDVGCSKKVDSGNLKDRARQNVIFELGYFIGKLGRTRVIALVENSQNFELPSDYHGVLYASFDTNNDKWKLELAKELNANGYQIDLQKIL